MSQKTNASMSIDNIEVNLLNFINKLINNLDNDLEYKQWTIMYIIFSKLEQQENTYNIDSISNYVESFMNYNFINMDYIKRENIKLKIKQKLNIVHDIFEFIIIKNALLNNKINEEQFYTYLTRNVNNKG